MVGRIDARLDLLELETLGRGFRSGFACGERGGSEQRRGGDHAERAAHHLAAVEPPCDYIADRLAGLGTQQRIVMRLAGRGPVAELVGSSHMLAWDVRKGASR